MDLPEWTCAPMVRCSQDPIDATVKNSSLTYTNFSHEIERHVIDFGGLSLICEGGGLIKGTKKSKKMERDRA